MNTISRTLTVSSLAVLLSGPAQANDTKFQVGKNATFRYYGWLHFANQSVDDGVTTTSNIIDVTNAASRFGFYIEPASEGVPISFHFESSLGFRASSKTSQTFTPDFWDWNRTDLRKVQFILDSSIGTFRLGQGSMTTDGDAESDFAGTVIVAKSTIPESHGAFEFRDASGALTGITVGDTFSNFDGSRRFRLRYDTNNFSGFSLAAAYGQEILKSGDTDDYYDFTIDYRGTIGNLEVKGAVGSNFVDSALTGTQRSTLGSVAVLHKASGLNLSLAGGQAGNGGGNYAYLKGGWNAKLLAAGPTKFVAEGFWGSDYVTGASQSRMWGLAVIQNFDAQNLEIYAGYRNFSYDTTTGVTFQDLGALQVGARWQF